MLRLTLAVMLLSGAPLAAQSLDGLWRSEGYGYVFEIKGPTLKAFEVTTQTCRPGFTARRQAASMAGRDATYRTSYGEVYFVKTGGGDRRLLHNDGSASDIRIDRLAKMPPECVPPTGNTPLDNFNVFTHTWAENYISFDLKHADWDGIVAQSRPKITDRTSPAALFEILQGMIQPFGDAHTFIHAQDLKRDFQGLRAGTDRAAKDVVGDAGLREFRSHGMARLLAVTDAAYLHGPLRRFCNDQLQFAKIDAGTGYLRVVSFSGYSKGGFAEGLSTLEEGLDQIFSDSALKALVIDVRINFGGEDPYGLSIASRLALSEYLAYTKYARSSAVEHDRWTPGDPSVVRPVSRPGFRGPVVELTGPAYHQRRRDLYAGIDGSCPSYHAHRREHPGSILRCSGSPHAEWMGLRIAE